MAAQQSPPPTNGNNNTNSRNSTGSDTSIADVEAAFLPEQGRGRRNLKDALAFKLPFMKKPLAQADADNDSVPKRHVRRYRWACVALSIVCLAFFAAFLAVELTHRSRGPTNGVELIVSRWGLPSPSSQQALTEWPTDFSRDITPIPCHSHNDYWRKVPLYDALAAGCTGVEADVWLDPHKPNELRVGHTRKSLTAARTLTSLYIDPLLTILNNQNTPTTATGAATNITTKVGVFNSSPNTSLTLLIDLKTASEDTFPVVLKLLQPLLEAGYLTTWTRDKGLVRGPITVVGTGNTDFMDILSPENSSPRAIFFDAPLPGLSNLTPSPLDLQYNSNNTYYASVSFDVEIGKPWLGMMTQEQVVRVRQQIQGAKIRGLVSRYWDTPAWPVRAKEGVWRVLETEA
ncbi:MAG: hypothetical protein Q9174_005739 [Haloplaca sp. 1 TL-2023]